MNDISKEVAVQAPAAMIELAITKGADLEKLEKILELQERWESNEAKKAFHVAMAEFKKNPPIIEKDQHVSFSHAKGKTEYSHASLFNVERKITAALSPHGLNVTWAYPKQVQELLTVRCTLTHELGHSEYAELSGPPDASGSKNPIQALGSASEYLRRYTLLAVTGLSTKGIDDDAQGEVDDTHISIAQIKEIKKLIKEKEADVSLVLTYAKAESVEKILASDYQKILIPLQEKKKPARVPGQEG